GALRLPGVPRGACRAAPRLTASSGRLLANVAVESYHCTVEQWTLRRSAIMLERVGVPLL
ncbi:MAG TPA: hypothetical protein VGS80_24740, partial [Ktedonobacterales bacterium]|nr:hypothetical protein [Ktedonobacterales bacterium]